MSSTLEGRAFNVLDVGEILLLWFPCKVGCIFSCTISSLLYGACCHTKIADDCVAQVALCCVPSGHEGRV